ncbi:hypothetical protein, partial [Bacteroides caccae]|uniref:hypothetical protein n=1 Tax=Bacteroides caccae TaxID=47678 RepID=UPI0034A3FE05
NIILNRLTLILLFNFNLSVRIYRSIDIIYYTDYFVYNDKGFSFAKGKLWTDLSTIDASRLQVYPASGRYLGEYCP